MIPVWPTHLVVRSWREQDNEFDISSLLDSTANTCTIKVGPNQSELAKIRLEGNLRDKLNS